MYIYIYILYNIEYEINIVIYKSKSYKLAKYKNNKDKYDFK